MAQVAEKVNVKIDEVEIYFDDRDGNADGNAYFYINGTLCVATYKSKIKYEGQPEEYIDGYYYCGGYHEAVEAETTIEEVFDFNTGKSVELSNVEMAYIIEAIETEIFASEDLPTQVEFA